jgi:arylsulfatase A-like enzyme
VDEKDLDDIPAAGVRMANPGGDHAAITKAGIWKECVRAYLASISFADAQLGRLLDALDASPSRDDTIVVLWGDHGWHLGEKLHWRKFTLWEEATRAPFIWVVPGTTKPGVVCERTVDFMSVYPTLSDLCGLPIPAHLEGPSIRPLLADPKAEWTTAALTTYGFRNHAVRTERWRYIRYADGSEELYDEVADPLEWKNLAGKEDLAGVKAELSRRLPAVDKEPSASLPRASAKGAARKKARLERAASGGEE